MSVTCNQLHQVLGALPRYRVPFDSSLMPRNGIYILFEEGEGAHSGDRIVRVGTHTGNNQLPSRLHQHFMTANKDRSIFRKNIGRALLEQRKDPYLAVWEIDFTTRASREQQGHLRNTDYQQALETEVTAYMQRAFSFTVIQIDDARDRLWLEAKIIATVAQCQECKASPLWLGKVSPKEKIRASSLWLVNELDSEPFTEPELSTFLQEKHLL